MLPEAEASASQGTCSVRKKKKKRKLYFSSKKALEKLRMRTANKEFSFQGHSKLLDFGNTEVADITGVTNDVLQAIQEVEEVMISDVNEEKCANEMILCPPFHIRYHFVDVYFLMPSFVGV
jgi:hypothetical protein